MAGRKLSKFEKFQIVVYNDCGLSSIIYIYIYIYYGCVHGVMVTIIGNGLGNLSANPG